MGCNADAAKFLLYMTHLCGKPLTDLLVMARSSCHITQAAFIDCYGSTATCTLHATEHLCGKTLTEVQVEHPVTEWISGVNIPSCQLMIGMGIRLDRMADIRRLFGKDPEGSGAIGTAFVTHLLHVHSALQPCCTLLCHICSFSCSCYAMLFIEIRLLLHLGMHPFAAVHLEKRKEKTPPSA